MKTLLIWLSLLYIVGCSPDKHDPPHVLYSAIDDLARTVSLPKSPNRIVSLAPSITETLFSLGLDSAIVGVTDYCDFPAAAKTKQSIGGMTSPDFEAIVALRPDLIVMSTAGNTRKDFETLVSLGLNVFVSNPSTIEDIFRSIITLGRLCGREDQGSLIVEQLRARQESVVRKANATPHRTALLLFSLRPVVSAGKGTFVDELLRLGNLTNVTHNASTAYPLVSREEVLSLQPDWIIVTDELVQSIDEIGTAYPEWRMLKAVREGRIASVNANLISRPGPRIIEGLASLVEATKK